MDSFKLFVDSSILFVDSSLSPVDSSLIIGFRYHSGSVVILRRWFVIIWGSFLSDPLIVRYQWLIFGFSFNSCIVRCNSGFVFIC